jgi:sugar/nucleoside kinase (ribokinase family)
MPEKCYDIFIIGHVSLDEIINNGEVEKRFGGAVLYSAYAAVAGGYKTGILTKTSPEIDDLSGLFNLLKDDIYHLPSKKTTSIRNKYLSSDLEKRACTAISIADPFRIEDVPHVKSRLYLLAGLVAGDYENDMITFLSKKGKVAVDVQGFLRKNEGGTLILKDWREKDIYLPYIDFLKADATEAEIMTGHNDRRKAAKELHNLGAKEVLITHNTEVIVYDGERFFSEPLKPRKLLGRTGRGDTCFSAYITERLYKKPHDALLYAAALVSLKMETPGPFRGTKTEVLDYIKKFYH